MAKPEQTPKLKLEYILGSFILIIVARLLIHEYIDREKSSVDIQRGIEAALVSINLISKIDTLLAQISTFEELQNVTYADGIDKQTWLKPEWEVVKEVIKHNKGISTVYSCTVHETATKCIITMHDDESEQYPKTSFSFVDESGIERNLQPAISEIDTYYLEATEEILLFIKSHLGKSTKNNKKPGV